MDPHRSNVDHPHFAFINIGKRIHYPVPLACFRPAAKTDVAGRMRPVAFGQVTPRRARSQYPECPVQYLSVIDPRHAVGLVRQQWLDRPPFKLGHLASAHPTLRSRGIESNLYCFGNPVYEFTAWCARSPCQRRRLPFLWQAKNSFLNHSGKPIDRDTINSFRLSLKDLCNRGFGYFGTEFSSRSRK